MLPISLLLYTLDSEEDCDKLTVIYEKYLNIMTAVARKYVSQSDVEDVVDDSIIKMINYLDRIDLDNELDTYHYICRIVKSCAIDWLRKADNTAEDIDEVSFSFEDGELPLIDRIIARDGYDYIVQCIRSIKDTYREVCEMRLIYNMSYEQISKELNITVKNVSVRYTRGLQQLKSMLREGGYYDK